MSRYIDAVSTFLTRTISTPVWLLILIFLAVFISGAAAQQPTLNLCTGAKTAIQPEILKKVGQ